MTPSAAAEQARADAVRQTAPLVPFNQASKRSKEVGFSVNVTPGVAPTVVGPVDLPPNGFIRFVDIHVKTAVAGTLGPGVVADGWPFNILDNIQFIDTGGQKMDDLSGYALFIDNLVGGTPNRSDPRAAYDYSASATAPNFRLRIARELFPDGRGALPNLSGSQKYRLRMVLSAISQCYSTAPTAAPQLTIDVIDHLWLLPSAHDGGGRPQQRRPPLLGLAQYRTAFHPNVAIAAGQVDQQIKSTGNLIKYIALIARDATGARNDNVFPDPFTLQADNADLIDAVPLSEVIHEYESMIPNRVSRDTGVLLIPFNYGYEDHVGGQGVASWLPTSTATYLAINGRQPVNTPGTIDFLVCEISTAEIDPAERSAIGSATGTMQSDTALGS